MKITRTADVLINVLMPIAAGVLIYICDSNTYLYHQVKNYLPDGLWAYSFLSALLIIWERSLPRFWLLHVFLSAILFEVLQYVNVLPGTGDVKDIIIYFLFFFIGLIFNIFFKKLNPFYDFR